MDESKRSTNKAKSEGSTRKVIGKKGHSQASAPSTRPERKLKTRSATGNDSQGEAKVEYLTVPLLPKVRKENKKKKLTDPDYVVWNPK